VAVPPTDTVVPLGTETLALAPGAETEALPLGTDTVALAPGNDTDAPRPGTDTDALPPGTLTVAVPPGADTVTGLGPVPRDGRPESPPLAWAPRCEPGAVAGACCWDVVEPGFCAAADAPPAALAPWPPIDAGVEIPRRGVSFGAPPALASRLPDRLADELARPASRLPR